MVVRRSGCPFSDGAAKWPTEFRIAYYPDVFNGTVLLDREMGGMGNGRIIVCPLSCDALGYY